jgi:hypothetical protein
MQGCFAVFICCGKVGTMVGECADEVRVSHVGGIVQSSVGGFVGVLGVGTIANEEQGHIRLLIAQGHEQRRQTVPFGVDQVRLGLEHNLGRVNIPNLYGLVKVGDGICAAGNQKSGKQSGHCQERSFVSYHHITPEKGLQLPASHPV